MNGVDNCGPCRAFVRFTSDPVEAVELGLFPNMGKYWELVTEEAGVCCKPAADTLVVVITLVTNDTMEEHTLATVVNG